MLVRFDLGAGIEAVGVHEVAGLEVQGSLVVELGDVIIRSFMPRYVRGCSGVLSHPSFPPYTSCSTTKCSY